MDMMFVVRRLQEIRRKVEMSLFMCFINLQKAYGVVDHTPVAGTQLALEYHRR